jgi:ABC-type uncharacterized transport system substrate-binding protein
MRRRTPPILTLALVGNLLAAPLAAEAQQAGKTARVGHLSPGGGPLIAARMPVAIALYGALRDLGWVEGQNLIIEWRSADGKTERLPDLARDLVRLNVDVIVVGSCGAVLDAARGATAKIPIVVATCNDDMVTAGIVASLGHPGGNITGLSKLTPELSAKRLSLLKETLPAVSRVGVLWNPDYSEFAADWRALREAARQLGITLHSVEVRRATDFDAALAGLRRERADAFMMFSDLIGFLLAREVAEAAARNRVPAIYAFREAVDARGLMSYGPNIEDMYRRAAVYVDKILRGAKPADLPIEQPSTFELVINLRTAKALGLTIPQSLLLRADQVIE